MSFLKLTDADSGTDHFLNETHIIKIVPNAGGPGSFVYLTPMAHSNEPHVVAVHEGADEIFRMMNRIHR